LTAWLKELLFLVVNQAFAISESIKNRAVFFVVLTKTVFTTWHSKWSKQTFYRLFIYSIFIVFNWKLLY